MGIRNGVQDHMENAKPVRIFQTPGCFQGYFRRGLARAQMKGVRERDGMVGGSGRIGIPGDSSRDLLIPLVEGHQQPLKGSLTHPKKVTSRIVRSRSFLVKDYTFTNLLSNHSCDWYV